MKYQNFRLKCPHCGYVWKPIKSRPKQCPSCSTYFKKNKRDIGKKEAIKLK